VNNCIPFRIPKNTQIRNLPFLLKILLVAVNINILSNKNHYHPLYLLRNLKLHPLQLTTALPLKTALKMQSLKLKTIHLMMIHLHHQAARQTNHLKKNLKKVSLRIRMQKRKSEN
jgi:hypothetical protein